MSNRIVFIHGSPRKEGCTRRMAGIAIEAALEHGAEVAEIDVAGLEYAVPGCSGCMQCQRSEEFACKIGDKLAGAVAGLAGYDVIAIATPTYWMSYPARLKMFVDRIGSLMKYTATGAIRTPLAGKAFAILATGNGGLENNLELLERQWNSVADYMSCRFGSCLFPNAPFEPGALARDPASIARAREFGGMLASL